MIIKDSFACRYDDVVCANGSLDALRFLFASFERIAVLYDNSRLRIGLIQQWSRPGLCVLLESTPSLKLTSCVDQAISFTGNVVLTAQPMNFLKSQQHKANKNKTIEVNFRTHTYVHKNRYIFSENATFIRHQLTAHSQTDQPYPFLYQYTYSSTESSSLSAGTRSDQ